jgi:hypothetical protein
MPLPLQRLFTEYEELVSTQVFSLLDEVEDHIARPTSGGSLRTVMKLPSRTCRFIPAPRPCHSRWHRAPSLLPRRTSACRATSNTPWGLPRLAWLGELECQR